MIAYAPNRVPVLFPVAAGHQLSSAQPERLQHGSSKGTTIPPGTIKHVVIIFQENRTPDNLFQDPVLIANHADIASSGMNSLGQTVQLTQGSLATDYDLSHSHSAFVSMYDGGKMDGADLIPV